MIGTCSDTATTNLGNKKGAVTILEDLWHHPLLKFECQRHVRELHVKHYGISISGRSTKGVGDKLFTEVRDNWDKKIVKHIDYQDLCLFDWSQCEFLVQKATESLALMDKLLDSNNEMFKRGDYISLAMLVRVYLTGDIHKFRFSKPIRTSHARFLQKGIYYLTCELLSYQLGDEQMKMNFSPLNDIDIVEDIRKLRDACSDDPKVVIAAEKCFESIYRHSRYLHPQLVVMALGSDKVMAIERKAIAEAMMVMKPQFDVKKVTLEYVYLLFK